VLRFLADLSADAIVQGKVPFTFRFYGRGVWTASGDPEPGDLLYGTWDTYDGQLQGRLYETYVRFERFLRDDSSLTLGRQFIDEGTYLQYDGARWDLKLEHFDLVVYGGGGVDYAEASGDEHWLVGVLAKGRIDRWRTRWRVQYLHVNQDFAGINDPTAGPGVDPVVFPAQTLNDDLVGVTLWQPFGESTLAYGRFTLLNGDANELHLRLRWATKDARWVVFADYYQLFQRLFNVTNDLTPFVPLLGSYDPFVRGTLRATWRPKSTLLLEAGASFRLLEDENDEGEFNHEWFNYYASVTVLDLFKERVDLTFAVNGYDSSGDEYTAVTSNADVRLRENVLLSGGVDYALYKYDWFSNSEREDVWTYRADLRWDVSEKLRAEFRVAVDDDSVATWTMVIARLTWRF